MEFCKFCHGSGKVYVRSEKDKFVLEDVSCPECHGTGLKDIDPPTVKYYYTQPFKCPVCNGTGMVESPFMWSGNTFVDTGGNGCRTPCHACGGTGIIWGYYDPTNHEIT